MENFVVMNEDDHLEFSVDPYDMLQEHDLLIQRLIKAHNEMARHFEDLVQQHQSMTGLLTEHKAHINKLERYIVKNLPNEIK
jgi:ribosomal protein S15P/S13E